MWTRLDIGTSSKRNLYVSAHWQIMAPLYDASAYSGVGKA
jgi:hypothetical protein